MRVYKFIIAIAIFLLLYSSSIASSISIVRAHVNNSKYSGAVDEIITNVIPQGTYAQVDVQMTFSSKGSLVPNGNDTLEIEFLFNLGVNDFISDAWLNFEGAWLQAEIMDLWTASQIYEDVVHRARKDPLLLKKLSATNYEMRVFPLTRDTSRTIKFTYYTPILFTENASYVNLPYEFIKKSTNPTEIIQVNIFENKDFLNSKIVKSESGQKQEIEGLFYEPLANSDFTGQTTYLTWSEINDSIYVKYDFPQKDGLFLTKSLEEDENYFQLAIKPFEDVRPVVPKKVCFILDFNASKTNTTKSELISSLKKAMLESFEITDKFQIYYANDVVYQYSNDWITANPESINSLFEGIDIDTILNRTKLYDMIMNSIDFINEKKDTAVIHIISSTDEDGSKERANEIIYDMKSKITKFTKIFVSAFVTKNWNKYNIGSLGYAGNDYLYRNLTQITGGIFNKIQDNQNNMYTLIKNSLGLYMQSMAEVVVSMEFKNGFGYSTYMSSSFDNLTKNQDYLTGIGKYIGDLPLSISLHGFYRDQPFYYNVDINEENSSKEIYNNKLIWTAKKIKDMEMLPNHNNVIKHDIIMASLFSRVLSIYTAFIALDPNLKDTTTNEEEEEEEVKVEEENSTKILDNLLVSTFPNPFTEFVTISLSSSLGNLQNSIESIAIFDINGKQIIDITNLISSIENGITIKWDGRDNNGDKLPEGVYFIVIQTSEGRYISKVVIQR